MHWEGKGGEAKSAPGARKSDPNPAASTGLQGGINDATLQQHTEALNLSFALDTGS